MKKEKLNVAIIVIMVIVTIALIGLIVYDAIKEYTLQKEDPLVISDLPIETDGDKSLNYEPPIISSRPSVNGEKSDGQKADIEFDVGTIDNISVPSLVGTKVDYGIKEGDGDE